MSGLSQKELAERLGLSDKTISAYETGRAIPPSSTLAKIAEITNVSVSKIMGESAVEDEYNQSRVNDRLDKIEERLSNIEQLIIKLISDK